MDYTNARRALQRVDDFEAQVDALLDRAVTNLDVRFYEHVKLMRDDYVRQAFLLDTADRNRWSSVRCMPVADIRRTVQ